MRERLPIEGRFRVVGDQPVREPVIRSWLALLLFVGVLFARWLWVYLRLTHPH